MEKIIEFNLNSKSVSIKEDDDLKLLWILRTRFGLTGTKYGCGEGHCGSCTVLINNRAIRSCLISLSEVAGKNITTIEGLSNNGDLHPMQKAFIKHDALQCGYCTPGMIMNAVGLLYKNPEPSRSDIILAMDDILCRCGSYNRIIDAIQTAAQEFNVPK